MSDKYWIDIKTKRDLKLFLWKEDIDLIIEKYRLSKGIRKYNPNHIYGEDCNLAALAINEAFRIFYDNPDFLFACAYRLKKAKEALLPSKEFSWFKRSNDACYFAWAYIRVLSKKNRFLENFGKNESFTVYTGTPYRRFIKIEYPVDHRERIECIENFFDRSSMGLSSKLSIMFNIRDEWNRRSQLADMLPLKKSEKEKINWAWDYICKDKANVIIGSIKRAQEKIAKETNTHQTDMPSEYIFNEACKAGLQGYVHNPHFISLFRPSTTTEKYLALRCIYICMYCYDNKFLSRFKKAWESSAYRKTKKKNPTGRKKSIIESEGQEYSNVTDAESVSAAIPSKAEKHQEKSLAQTIKEKPIERTPSPGIDAGGDKEVKDYSADNWHIFPY
ncbi:hypothetical protein R4P48_05100 [Atlantibacter subterranea]|uniref:Uncharacterized protein n=1 Tax=Atlantibacter subterraneus TaxID=255519 RepID=A0ABU4DYX7_9ENTR|nr:hypothetical protein [Atlantibacter subterranea]MDV7022057.1 hypothetical protein [Atlantibacter subterranea]MDZ5665598.1 hypothetical protein [Atlantibacter hermannii]